MKKIKLYKSSFIAIFILLTLISFVFIRANRHGEELVPLYEDYDVSNCIIGYAGYETEDGKNFRIIAPDPQIYLDINSLGNGKAYAILIKLGNVINLSNAQVFYGRDGWDLSEEDSNTFIERESNEIEVGNPINGFNYIRLDIDEDFSIESIQVAYGYKSIRNNVIKPCIIAILINLLISIATACSLKTNKKLIEIKNSISYILKTVIQYRPSVKFYRAIIIEVAGLLIIYLWEYIYNRINGIKYNNNFRVLIAYGAFTIVYLTLINRTKIIKWMHIYYFAILLLIGTITIWVVPPALGVGLDDETHYSHTAYLSWSKKDVYSYTDAKIISNYANTIFNDDVYKLEGRQDWIKEINNTVGTYPILVDHTDSWQISYVAYIPGAIGLIIGRGLGFTACHTFMFGKWMNLLCYAGLLSLSIKALSQRGKLLVAVLGLIPTNIFIATSYAYDWWLTGLVIYGYSIFFGELQKYEKVRTKTLIKAVLLVAIGIMPKAVYFPIIAPMLFFKNNKYEAAAKCRIIGIVAMLIMMSTFIIPLLINGAGTGDVRGGSAVNSTEQLAFILQNPLEYTQILLNFLWSYLSLNNAQMYLTYLMYYGQAMYYELCLMIIGAVAVLDNVEIKEGKRLDALSKAGNCISLFATVVLVATSMYIAFTPVKYETVLGCQARYLLPLLFPFWYFMGELDIAVSEKMKATIFSFATIVMSLIYFYGLYTLRVCDYL